MIFFRRIEFFKRSDFSDDRRTECARFGQLLFVVLGLLTLLVVVKEDRRPVLRADVVALPVERRRVVRLPECCQQIGKRNDGRIVGDLHHFGVAGQTSANLIVRRIGDIAAAVARDDGFYAFKLIENRFGAPKAARAKRGLL